MSPSVVILGHVCHDIIPHGHRLGGAASYASLLASSLGLQPQVITSYGQDFAYESLFSQHGVILHNQPSESTTIFHNQDKGDMREQRMEARAGDLFFDSTFVNDFDIAFVCPIADEVDIYNTNLDNTVMVGLLQGWMRDSRKTGPVVPKELDPRILDNIDIAICSEEDLKLFGASYLDRLTQLHNHLVITHGSKGVTIIIEGTSSFFPSYQTEVIDSTGAGDIYGMAYTLAFHDSHNVATAASFAHAAASLSIEGYGTDAIPSLEEIKVRQELYQKRYL